MPPFTQQSLQMPIGTPYYYNPAYGQPYPQRYSQEPQSAMNYLRCRPVTSFDEVRAAQIDLDGSLSVFPDIGNKKVYTKQIRPDGTADYQVYTLTPQEEHSNTIDYVTKAELEQVLTQFKASLMASMTPPASTESKKMSF